MILDYHTHLALHLRNVRIDSAEATAAAIEAAAGEVDVSAAENAAALGVLDTAEELHDKLKEQRRKRYREKTFYEVEAKIQKNSRNSGNGKTVSHEEQLSMRREKDRIRYSSMSAEQRHIYNEKRREQYHRQNELSRQKRRERERSRYHALDNETAKERNARRAQLERERYQKLAPNDLEEKNCRRRKRAALARQKKMDAEKVRHRSIVRLLKTIYVTAAIFLIGCMFPLSCFNAKGNARQRNCCPDCRRSGAGGGRHNQARAGATPGVKFVINWNSTLANAKLVCTSLGTAASYMIKFWL